MIELIHDPFSLWGGARELLVDSPMTRQHAFQSIDKRLVAGSEDVQILIATPYWKQFKSAYRGVGGVALQEITPSSVLHQRLRRSSSRAPLAVHLVPLTWKKLRTNSQVLSSIAWSTR